VTSNSRLETPPSPSFQREMGRFLGDCIPFIRDCYFVHRSAQIKQVAALGIEQHLLPLGATGLSRPLNRPGFSVVRARAKKAFHDECMKDPGMGRMTRDAVEDLVTTWDCIPLSSSRVHGKMNSLPRFLPVSIRRKLPRLIVIPRVPGCNFMKPDEMAFKRSYDNKRGRRPTALEIVVSSPMNSRPGVTGSCIQDSLQLCVWPRNAE
jgi:hypothetical protein